MRAKLITLGLVGVGIAVAGAAWVTFQNGSTSADAQDGCLGQAPTIVAVEGETTVGTNGADVIVGTDEADTISAKRGDDTICSHGGDDTVRGGSGDDTIDLGPGDDTASGGPGDDKISGKRGDDTIKGNKGRDDLRGGKGQDIIAGGPNADRCRGNKGKDSLRSCANRDRGVFYVSPAGDDDASGTKANPWGTLQHGADQLGPGDTLYVRGGVYSQLLSINVSGKAGSLIKIRNYPGETPVLDGSGIREPAGWAPLIRIRNQSYVRVRGFELRDQKTNRGVAIPIGILVHGAGTNIEIFDNFVHHIEHNGTGQRNAHGIAVYGTETEPLTGIAIDGNELSELTLGTSETIVLNGNVDGFVVSNNLVHDNDNIGIDIIGFEGNAPTPELDRARNGVVRNNEVYRIDAAPNPSYTERSAGGIYVDGGHDIVIENNLVSDNNIGIELASEHGDGNTSGVIVRNNVITGNHIGGLLLGGFDSDRGFTANCSITNNTLYRNDTDLQGGGEILLQFDVRNCDVLRNIIVAGEHGVLVSNPFRKGSGNRFDANLYSTTGNAQWEWRRDSFNSLAGWRQATGNDSAGLFGTPGFVNAALADFRLGPLSDAIGAGPNGATLGADISTVGRR